MTDALLARLTAPAPDEVRAKFVPVSFPVPPKFVKMNRDPNGPLPKVDKVLCMWTAAEKQAVADVFGVPESEWFNYAHDFASYGPDFTWRSPAKEVRRLGEGAVVTFGSTTVLLLHSQSHLATDSIALPLRRFIGQVIIETGCSDWLDTGTSGGVGSLVLEGDTVAARNLVFDCTGDFKDEPWAHQSFATTLDLSGIDWAEAESLMATNAHLLPPGQPRAPKVWTGSDLATCDSFLFDAVGDPYQLEKYDAGELLCEEMDAAVLGLVAEDLGAAMPRYASLRSISDPQMPAMPGGVPAEKRAASAEYDQFGYGAQVETSTACCVAFGAN